MQAQESGEQQQLARSFTHAAHKGVVKCIASVGQWAATGGADDLIHLYDLKVSCRSHRSIEMCTQLVHAAWRWAARRGAQPTGHSTTPLRSTQQQISALGIVQPAQPCRLPALQNDKDLGFLMSPGEGAVTALAFFAPAGAYNPTHMLSGSADGSLSVWAAGGGWESMKTMRGHRKEVTAIAVHPSGLVALTTSRCLCRASAG